MRERPIIFNSEMVRAVLDGRKTQTRRIIQSPAKNMQARGHECISYRAPGDKWYQDYVFSMRDRSGTWQDYKHEQFLAKCPFGAVGDRLWLRETASCEWQRCDFKKTVCETGVVYSADGVSQTFRSQVQHKMFPRRDRTTSGDLAWHPSIHMPRWASRITLEITGIRVERLKSISEEDAQAEGVQQLRGGFWRHYAPEWTQHQLSARGSFLTLWDSIYGEESWQANPWVWVIEFKRVEGQ